MRIVGGKYKGRLFNPNKKMTARPTTDIAKEGLFNILENRTDFSGKSVLDLFSGTGSIGYEFISRGVGEVTFVEKDFHHSQFIQSVINDLKIENARIFKTDVFKFLFKYQGQFDIVFADPPYNLLQLKEVPDAVFSRDVLKKGGLFILEHPKEHSFSNHPCFREIRNYGKVNFSFFEA
jgi:16S rRNA (guanine(966)-N(2))-methyltransferase RsmD